MIMKDILASQYELNNKIELIISKILNGIENKTFDDEFIVEFILKHSLLCIENKSKIEMVNKYIKEKNNNNRIFRKNKIQ